MIAKFLRYYHTLKPLKFVQIKYRAFYIIRNRYRKLINFKRSWKTDFPTPQVLNFEESIPSYARYQAGSTFIFLNQKKEFINQIDWNFSGFGKLWTYNLTYFEYLNQEDISVDSGLKLIHDFIDNVENIDDGLEPFPISLRIINWIKFIIKNNIKDQKVEENLFAQVKVLSKNLEYHLLGNHLLENGFAMLFASYYFQNSSFFKIAKEILVPELEEQILDDGAHFELSPMYHQLMLFRILDSTNLIKNNLDVPHENLLTFFTDKASRMLGWLNQITFTNGNIPLVNDCARGIAPSTDQLNKYCKSLNVLPLQQKLNKSGYRKFENRNYEIVVDVGQVGPTYIPGHGHADIFNFVLYINQSPFIIDTGTSTYEKNKLRFEERSTFAHNTVQINTLEQSDVWGGFRVGKRASVEILEEEKNKIRAVHNGFKKISGLHERGFEFLEKEIVITDTFVKTEGSKIAIFNFAPSIKIKSRTDNTISTDQATISFNNVTEISILSSHASPEFNLKKESTKVLVRFDNLLTTTIKMN